MPLYSLLAPKSIYIHMCLYDSVTIIVPTDSVSFIVHNNVHMHNYMFII